MFKTACPPNYIQFRNQCFWHTNTHARKNIPLEDKLCERQHWTEPVHMASIHWLDEWFFSLGLAYR